MSPGLKRQAEEDADAEAEKVRLEQLRLDAIRRDLGGLPKTDDYLAESRRMPKWGCSGCGTTGIPCAQGECPHCGKGRPAGYRDPEQGEGRQLGFYREKADRR